MLVTLFASSFDKLNLGSIICCELVTLGKALFPLSKPKKSVELPLLDK